MTFRSQGQLSVDNLQNMTYEMGRKNKRRTSMVDNETKLEIRRKASLNILFNRKDFHIAKDELDISEDEVDIEEIKTTVI